MAEKRNRLKEILEWLHHVYWISEFLISSGATAAAMKWLARHFPSFAPYAWPVGILIVGILMYSWGFVRKHGPKSQKSDEDSTIKREDAQRIINEKAEDSRMAGGQAALLWSFEAAAKQLTQMLEEAWHHWNDVGERLIHPLNALLDPVKDYSAEYAHRLLDERRDFMVLYAFHISRLRLDLPGFSSPATQNGYPCDEEYVEVLNSLRRHSHALAEKAQNIWDAELPDEQLYQMKKPQAAILQEYKSRDESS